MSMKVQNYLSFVFIHTHKHEFVVFTSLQVWVVHRYHYKGINEWLSVQTGARAGGGAAKAAYGGVYTATTAATSYPTQAYSQPAQQQPKREFTVLLRFDVSS